MAQPLDARSDLFSVGTVLYLLTTGRKPFDGRDGLGRHHEGAQGARCPKPSTVVPRPEPGRRAVHRPRPARQPRRALAERRADGGQDRRHRRRSWGSRRTGGAQALARDPERQGRREDAGRDGRCGPQHHRARQPRLRAGGRLSSPVDTMQIHPRGRSRGTRSPAKSGAPRRRPRPPLDTIPRRPSCSNPRRRTGRRHASRASAAGCGEPSSAPWLWPSCSAAARTSPRPYLPAKLVQPVEVWLRGLPAKLR